MKINFKSNNFLRIFLGLVFVSAGIYRIFNWQEGVLELARLNLYSIYLLVFIIALEVIGGLLLIFNIKTKWVLASFIVFILLALFGAFISNGKDIILRLKELFVFNPTPTDVFLHFTYLAILVYLFSYKTK